MDLQCQLTSCTCYIMYAHVHVLCTCVYMYMYTHVYSTCTHILYLAVAKHRSPAPGGVFHETAELTGAYRTFCIAEVESCCTSSDFVVRTRKHYGNVSENKLHMCTCTCNQIDVQYIQRQQDNLCSAVIYQSL